MWVWLSEDNYGFWGTELSSSDLVASALYPELSHRALMVPASLGSSQQAVLTGISYGHWRRCDAGTGTLSVLLVSECVPACAVCGS